MEDKAALRRYWKERLVGPVSGDAGLTPVLAAWAMSYQAVLGTLPLPGEPDLTSFYAFWLNQGRQLGLARTAGGSLDFGLIDDLGSWTTRGPLREPPASARPWEAGHRTLVLVPGLAFSLTAEGVVRLGRGGGYYDRWLAVHGRAVTAVGVGLPFQLTPTLPREPHDVLLDGYLDSEGFHGLSPQLPDKD